MRLLARREYSRAELTARLQRIEARNGDEQPDRDRAAAEGEIASILDELEREGWLDEGRAADALVHSAAARYGRHRLQRMLQHRAIAAEPAARALAGTAASEFDRAVAIWQRRFGSPAPDLRERSRQHQFLLRRGFDPSLVEQVLRRAEQGESSPPDDTR